MKSPRNQAKSEEGSVLVISLIMLSLLTLIGIMGMTNTETEILIARNEMFHKIAFFTADAGVYATPKLISSASFSIQSEQLKTRPQIELRQEADMQRQQ